MAQTTGAFSGVDFTIEVSTDGSTWTDISGSANAVTPGTQTQMTGTIYTGQGRVAIVTSGKLEPLEVEVRIVYTEESGEGFAFIRPEFEAGDRIYFRYSPKGIGATGRAVFTASNDQATAGAVVISSLEWPTVDAGSADPLAVSFTLMCPALIRTTTGNSTGLGSA
jgi:hypothetical protein